MVPVISKIATPFYKLLAFGAEPDSDIYLGIRCHNITGLQAHFGAL